ncbi:uncharacterized protein C8A04DRAFT_25377 [Dichotomopilus funicola]|uniref:Uncharacterized protein n=1 Tax=Dichotomopilus funicola TaxID=1934379 RepID=A0AAN6V8H6_9PEZI|nr:hypothetical protein C8A04DRAFT_25377 [Dichotomopilus funicola]
MGHSTYTKQTPARDDQRASRMVGFIPQRWQWAADAATSIALALPGSAILTGPLTAFLPAFQLGPFEEPEDLDGEEEAADPVDVTGTGMVWVPGQPRPEQLSRPDVHTAELVFGQGKGLVSLMGSFPAVPEPVTKGSGINWKSARQGLDLLLNSIREHIDQKQQQQQHQQQKTDRKNRNPVEDCDSYFERSTYLNGTQHILRGLPRDLDNNEAAVLHRAMPATLADRFEHVANASNGKKRPLQLRERGFVHTCVFLAICLLSMAGAWFLPRLAALGSQLVQAEQEHKYLPQLVMAVTGFLQTLGAAFRWLGGTWPGQLIAAVSAHAGRGVRSALFAFGERIVEENPESEVVARAAAVSGMAERDGEKPRKKNRFV